MRIHVNYEETFDCTTEVDLDDTYIDTLTFHRAWISARGRLISADIGPYPRLGRGKLDDPKARAAYDKAWEEHQARWRAHPLAQLDPAAHDPRIVPTEKDLRDARSAVIAEEGLEQAVQGWAPVLRVLVAERTVHKAFVVDDEHCANCGELLTEDDHAHSVDSAHWTPDLEDNDA